MTTIHVTDLSGQTTAITAATGLTLMQAIRDVGFDDRPPAVLARHLDGQEHAAVGHVHLVDRLVRELDQRARAVGLAVDDVLALHDVAELTEVVLVRERVAVRQRLGQEERHAVAERQLLDELRGEPGGFPLGAVRARQPASACHALQWQIAGSALSIAVFGMLITLSQNLMAYAFHSYMTELFPTRVRARAVGFTYAFSRLGVVFGSFIIGFFFAHFDGTAGVFGFIAGSMLIAVLAIALFGPRTRNLELEQISH